MRMDTKRRDSEESLTSATESELVAQVNKLSTAISGTNNNVTMLNERLTEYQRTHEEALQELRRNLMSPRFLESTPKVSKGCYADAASGDHSPVNTLVTVLREKDLSMSALQKENNTLRERLEKLKFDLEKSQAETRAGKENLMRWKRMAQTQLTTNLASVNWLIKNDPTIAAPVKQSLLSETRPCHDFIMQQAELTSKLQWLCQNSQSRGKDPS